MRKSAAIEPDLCTLAHHEIQRWYDVFYDWSRGFMPHESGPHSIFDALAHDFRVVLTDGRMMNKREYGIRLMDLYGARSDSPRSQITHVDLQQLSHAHVLATFNLVKPGSPRKFNTAILRHARASPYTVLWMYVHESVYDS